MTQQTTIRKLAELVNTPVEKLLEQLAEAGMSFSGPDQVVTSIEKVKLLGFLKRSHGKSESAAEEVVAENVGDASGAAGGGQLEQVAAVVGQAEGDVGAGQGQALDGIGAVGEFGAFRLEEFAAGRGVVIEVAHFDDGAGHQRCRFRL